MRSNAEVLAQASASAQACMKWRRIPVRASRYDIIKVHGGVLIAIVMKVQTLCACAATQAGKLAGGSKFIIFLPVKDLK